MERLVIDQCKQHTLTYKHTHTCIQTHTLAYKQTHTHTHISTNQLKEGMERLVIDQCKQHTLTYKHTHTCICTHYTLLNVFEMSIFCLRVIKETQGFLQENHPMETKSHHTQTHI